MEGGEEMNDKDIQAWRELLQSLRWRHEHLEPLSPYSMGLYNGIAMVLITATGEKHRLFAPPGDQAAAVVEEAARILRGDAKK